MQKSLHSSQHKVLTVKYGSQLFLQTMQMQHQILQKCNTQYYID